MAPRDSSALLSPSAFFRRTYAYASAQEPDTTTQPRSSKDRKKREKALHRELSDPFNSWLNEDVYYITTSDQKKMLRSLAFRPTKSATSSSSTSGTPPLQVRIS
jgi:hypothetical protein